MQIEKIARVAHEVSAAYSEAMTGAERMPWDQQTEEYRAAVRAEVVKLVAEQEAPQLPMSAKPTIEEMRQALFVATVHALRDGAGQAHINHFSLGDKVIAGKRRVLPAEAANVDGKQVITGGGSEMPAEAEVTAIMFKPGMVMYEVNGQWHEASHVFAVGA